MTGYSVSLEGLAQQLSYPPYRKVIAPLIEEWFEGTLITVDGELNLKTSTGDLLSVSMLHAAIQADQEKQYKLYQSAMSLWR